MDERGQAADAASLEASPSGAMDTVATPQPDVSEVRLSRREREVALLIAQGLANRQIGMVLAIKERTVEDHVGRLLRKLHLTNRAQVILWTIATGLVVAPSPTSPGLTPTVGGESPPR